MLSHLKTSIKHLTLNAKYATKYDLFGKAAMDNNRASTHFYSKSPKPSSDVDIVDINIDKMMYEDDEFASNYNYEPKPQTTKTTDLNGGSIAPIDINPWIDEELEKDGTVDMQHVERCNEEIHYSEPPKERSGYYEFEGIKIWLPKKMLTPATYRYRLDGDDEQTLPDDIRICKFEKFKPTS